MVYFGYVIQCLPRSGNQPYTYFHISFYTLHKRKVEPDLGRVHVYNPKKESIVVARKPSIPQGKDKTPEILKGPSNVFPYTRGLCQV